MRRHCLKDNDFFLKIVIYGCFNVSGMNDNPYKDKFTTMV
jgi:hypothetical protein